MAATIRMRPAPARAARGFSLIELMVTVLVIGILGGIALPSYLSSVRKSRRTEARTALLDLAGREERYYSTNNSTYTQNGPDLGYPAFPTAVGSGYYNVNVTVTGVPLVAGVPPTYTITATPDPAKSQAQDLGCTQFQIDNTGLQTSQGGDNCWQ